MCRRAGILTGFPSAAALAIALGSPNPWLIAIATETLDFRGLNFSFNMWLLMPTFSLPRTPPVLADPASLHVKCSPTACQCKALAAENADLTQTYAEVKELIPNFRVFPRSFRDLPRSVLCTDTPASSASCLSPGIFSAPCTTHLAGGEIADTRGWLR